MAKDVTKGEEKTELFLRPPPRLQMGDWREIMESRPRGSGRGRARKSLLHKVVTDTMNFSNQIQGNRLLRVQGPFI